MTGRSPNRYIAQGNTLGVSELSNLRSEKAAGGSSLAILPIPFALSERRIVFPFLPRALPWAVFLLGFQPVIARKHCCCTVFLTIFLFCFQPAISCDLGCCTILFAILLLELRSVFSCNYGCYTVPWTVFLFCFQPVISCDRGCCTIPCALFLLGFRPSLQPDGWFTRNRGKLLP